MISARHMPAADIKIIIANGKALVIAAVCRASRPPATSRTEATMPSVLAQKTRCQIGVSIMPPEDNESITNEPESDDVTKKVMMSNTVRKLKILVIGRFS